MGLKVASIACMTALFALMYALVFVIGIWFLGGLGLLGLLIMIGLTLFIVFLQYLISPLIIGWIYRIDWIPYDQYQAQFPHLADVVNKVCQLRGVKIPRMGIVHDLNPNAFTYGWTKNKARVVVTDGILKHLNEEEQSGVMAHEMGHVVHSDFILMTIVFAIPLVLLTIARWAYYSAIFSSMRRRSRDSDTTSYLFVLLFVVAVLSYMAYYVGYLISLIISRIREYYADEHAAEVLENPNALSTALVKIAYGLVASGGYETVKERNKSKVRGAKGLGIFDPSAASHFAAMSTGGSGKFSKDAIQAAAAWDLFNPWAKYYQIFSTHPLPAKRILRLNDQCELYGKKPEIDFSKARQIKEEQAGKSMLPEFGTDVFIKELPIIPIIFVFILTTIWVFALFGVIPIAIGQWSFPVILLWWAIAFVFVGVGCILKTMFMYKKGYENKTVLDLVTYVKASPIRCVPAKVKGQIIGRGVPGYYFSEDLYFQDETGLMYIDYRFGLRIVDFFFGILTAKKLVGQRVKIKGWYRRGPAPYLQVKYIEAENGKVYKNHARGLTFFWAILAFIVAAIIFSFAIV